MIKKELIKLLKGFDDEAVACVARDQVDKFGEYYDTNNDDIVKVEISVEDGQQKIVIT